MSKVQFDGQNRLIIINTGITDIDVRVDLYLEWKNWVLQDNNSQWLAAFRAFGGDPTTVNQNAPSYYFLINNWLVKVENLPVTFNDNLYSDDYTTPFINNGSTILSKNTDIPNIDPINSVLTGLTESIQEISLDIKHILGLSQQNYRLSDHVYDSSNRLTSVIIKLFKTKDDCDFDINEFATYNMNAVYDNVGLLIDYKVVKL